jgi:hypothetical protein
MAGEESGGDGDVATADEEPSVARDGPAVGYPLGAALFALALVAPLAVALALWAFEGGRVGLVVGASSLWVTATLEVVGYYLALARRRGESDPWAALRPRRARIKRLSWAIALVDLAVGAALVAAGVAPFPFP